MFKKKLEIFLGINKWNLETSERETKTHTLLFTESKTYLRTKYQGAHILIINPKEQTLALTKSTESF